MWFYQRLFFHKNTRNKRIQVTQITQNVDDTLGVVRPEIGSLMLSWDSTLYTDNVTVMIVIYGMYTFKIEVIGSVPDAAVALTVPTGLLDCIGLLAVDVPGIFLSAMITVMNVTMQKVNSVVL